TAREQVRRYMSAAEKAGWPDRNGDGRPFKTGWDSERKRGFGLGRYIHICDYKGVGDREVAMAGLRAEWEYTGPFGFNSAVVDFDDPVPDKITPELMIEKKTALIGPPELIIEEVLKSKEAIGYDDLMLWLHMEFPGLGLERTAEQLEVFAEEVLPVLREELGGGPNWP